MLRLQDSILMAITLFKFHTVLGIIRPTAFYAQTTDIPILMYFLACAIHGTVPLIV